MSEIENEEHALYRFYGGRKLLYIGISIHPFARMGRHREDKSWWGEVDTVRIERHPDRASVLAAERAAIKAEKPKYNLVHNKGRPPVFCTYTTWWDGQMVTLYNVAHLKRTVRCDWCRQQLQITVGLIKSHPRPPEVGSSGYVTCPHCARPVSTGRLTPNGVEEQRGRVQCLT